MKNRKIRVSVSLLTIVILLCLLPACRADNIKIKIKDAFTETRISTETGKTVADVLAEAEILLGAKDKVTPEKNKVISKACIINISRYTTSTVTCDGKTTKVQLLGATVSDALKKAGITLSETDYVNHNTSAFVTNGMNISIVRRLSIEFTDNGKTKRYLTEAKTVGGFLKEQGIKLGKDDIVTPKQTEKISGKTRIVVKRVAYKTVTKTEIINYSTKYEESSTVAAGSSVVTTEGKNGKKKVTYTIKYVDGKEKSRKKIKEKVITEPVDEVLTQGITETQPATQKKNTPAGKTEVSRQRVDDCDGSGHGYYIIKYSDGSESYETY